MNANTDPNYNLNIALQRMKTHMPCPVHEFLTFQILCCINQKASPDFVKHLSRRTKLANIFTQSIYVYIYIHTYKAAFASCTTIITLCVPKFLK